VNRETLAIAQSSDVAEVVRDQLVSLSDLFHTDQFNLFPLVAGTGNLTVTTDAVQIGLPGLNTLSVALRTCPADSGIFYLDYASPSAVDSLVAF